MQPRCFSEFIFIRKTQSSIFESQGSIRANTVEELWNQKGPQHSQIHLRSSLPEWIESLESLLFQKSSTNKFVINPVITKVPTTEPKILSGTDSPPEDGFDSVLVVKIGNKMLWILCVQSSLADLNICKIKTQENQNSYVIKMKLSK